MMRLRKKLKSVTRLVAYCALLVGFVTVVVYFLQTRTSQSSGGMCSLKSHLDPVLLQHIKKNHIVPPPHPATPYNLNKDDMRVSEEEREYREYFMQVVTQYGPKNGGFFIEAGALDRQYLSHTLELERDHGWTGLLVEALPSSFAQLAQKNRKAWLANLCLSDEPCKPVEFFRKMHDRASSRRNLSLVANTGERANPKEFISEGMVPCFPLLPVLKAIPVDKVDFFVLDVEGGEYEVLKYFPFDEVPIKIIAVGIMWLGEAKSELLLSLMIRNNYKLVFRSRQDVIFVRASSRRN